MSNVPKELTCSVCDKCTLTYNKQELCTYVKCTARSKRGRTISWFLTVRTPAWKRIESSELANNFVNTHKRPFWCPKNNRFI